MTYENQQNGTGADGSGLSDKLGECFFGVSGHRAGRGGGSKTDGTDSMERGDLWWQRRTAPDQMHWQAASP